MTATQARVRPGSNLEYPFEVRPEIGDSIVVAPGVHWVRMRLPMQLNHINLWLLEDGDGWTIRDTSYEMKVAPVDGNRAMLLVRPAAADFLFPAGRYALVLKSVPYDFSVDGPAADAARCVEATDGNNHAAVHARCRE